MKKHFVYIARCADGTLYTGYTTDLKRREEAHNTGKGARYTRSRLPVKMIYSEKLRTKSLATQREYQIKQLKRNEKLELIRKTDVS